MQAKVKANGLLIPKKFLQGITEAEIKKERGKIIVLPTKIENDPLWGLGSKPGNSGLKDASVNHDKYIYEQA